MHQFYKSPSFYLLVSYIVACLVRKPELSDAFIVIALGALYGFHTFLDAKKESAIPATEMDKEIRKMSQENELDRMKLAKQQLENQQKLESLKIKNINEGMPNRGKISF